MTGTSHTFRHSGITPTSVAACLMPADFLTTKFRMAALHMADFHAAAGASTLEEEGTDEHEPSRPTGRELGAASPCVGGDLRLARAGDLGRVRRCRCSILTRPIQIFSL